MDSMLPRISGITRHHLAICITSLWTSSYYQKRHTLPVLCYICLNSLLVPPCWRHFQRAPLRLFPCLSAGQPTACIPPSTLGPTPKTESLSPTDGSSSLSAASEQVVLEGLTLFLHGLQFLLVHNVLSRVTDPVGLLESFSSSLLRQPPK